MGTIDQLRTALSWLLPAWLPPAWLLPVVALLAAGCGTPGPPAPGFETRAVDAPPAAPRPAGRVFTVDPEASELRIVVFAAGRLAALGHPHVIGG